MSTPINIGLHAKSGACAPEAIDVSRLSDGASGKTRFFTAALLALAIVVVALLSPTPALASDPGVIQTTVM